MYQAPPIIASVMSMLWMAVYLGSARIELISDGWVLSAMEVTESL